MIAGISDICERIFNFHMFSTYLIRNYSVRKYDIRNTPNRFVIEVTFVCEKIILTVLYKIRDGCLLL